MIDRTIKIFEIKELIATGGMAAIYKTVQISLDKMIAIKILHGHLAQDKNFITRFEREAKAAANLKHENIVNIIDYGHAEDIYFIAMEFVEGKSCQKEKYIAPGSNNCRNFSRSDCWGFSVCV